MSKLIDYDLYFIHIPKNAGTSFEKQFCKTYNGHHRLIQFKQSIWNKTVAIVRNPYTRLISLYNYTKLEKSFWHSNDNTTKYPLHELYEYSNNHTFSEFIIDICINNKFADKIHLLPQYTWVITPDNKIVSHIIKMENLDNELSSLLNKTVKLIKINTSNTSSYEGYYTDYLKSLVYNKYKLDFELFDYEK